MSGGGGTQTQVTTPWSGAQPYLTDVLQQSSQLYKGGGPAYYPGQTFVGPTEGQIGAWGTQLNYADQVFGGQQAPQFGQATGALGNALAGNTSLGSMANTLSPIASSALQSGFSGGAPSFNPSQFTPSLGSIGGMDTTGAFSKALSGQPDYSAVNNAIGAANQQQFNQLYSDVIPQLNQRASFLGNPSGALKSLNSTLTNLTNNQNLNAQQTYLGQLNRAQDTQQQAAQYLTGAGLQAAGLGQQGAVANANVGGDYRQQLLGLGGLAGNLASGASSDALRGVSLFPSLAQTGTVPGQLQSQFADWGANFQNQALQDQLNRYNYYQNLPYQNLSQYSGLVNGYGGLGGTTSTKVPNNPVAGAAGGAILGNQIGSGIGSGYGGWGAILGSILGGIG